MKQKLKLITVVKFVSLLFLFLYFSSVFIFSYKKELILISHILFFGFAGLVIFYRIIRLNMINTKFYIYIICIIAFSIMSYYWAIDKTMVTTTTKTYFNLTLLAFAIINIIETEWEVDFALKSLAFAGIAMCLYTIVFYGFDEMLMMMKAGERLGGEINQENTFGMITSLSFSILIMFAVFDKKKLYYILSVIPFICALTSGSKKVIIVLVVTFALLIILNSSSKKIMSTVILITVAIVVWSFISQSEYFAGIFDRFETFKNVFNNNNIMEQTDSSSNERMNMIKYAWELFLKNPIWGYGTNQFNQLYLNTYGWYTYSHCFYAQILTSHGIIGFILYMLMYYDIIKSTAKQLKNCTSAKVLFSVIIIMMVNGIAAEYSHDKIYFIILGIGFSFLNVYKSNKIANVTESEELSDEITKIEEEVTE